jgi:hypothetical protein
MWTKILCIHFKFHLDIWMPAPFLCTTLLLAVNCFVPHVSIVVMWHVLKHLGTCVSWFGCHKPCHALCLCQLSWRIIHKDMYGCSAIENRGYYQLWSTRWNSEGFCCTWWKISMPVIFLYHFLFVNTLKVLYIHCVCVSL